MSLLVCLNRGWGDRELWSRALAEEGHVTFVYVVVPQVGMARAVRRASRTLTRARATAAASGADADEAVVRAPSVPDGLRTAQAAIGGEVGLAASAGAHRQELERRRVPVHAVRW